MSRLTPACTLLLFSLKRKHGYFSSKSRLSEDGSFYYSDEALAKELSLGANTIRRAKRRLGELGYLRFIPGKHEGIATKYFLLPEPPKMIPSHTIKEDTKMIPSQPRQEGANLAQEGANLVPRASQNGSPIKEITNILTNKGAGSASACPDSQASPAFSLDPYRGHTIETESELGLLIRKFGKTDVAKLIETGEITLGEGVQLQ